MAFTKGECVIMFQSGKKFDKTIKSKMRKNFDEYGDADNKDQKSKKKRHDKSTYRLYREEENDLYDVKY